jgi:hypothetical protein
MSTWSGDVGTKYLTSQHVKTFFSPENGEWFIPTPSSADAKKQTCSSKLYRRAIHHVEGDALWSELVQWLQDELFSPDKPRFAVIKIGLSILDSSVEVSGDLSELNRQCSQKDTEELFMRGDDVKCALLHSLLRAGVVANNPSYFVPGNRYEACERHMKERTVELVKELGLHWDPLEISVLGMTYQRDENFVGGHARVSDLAAYLKQYGCWRQEKDGSHVPFCTVPYPLRWSDKVAEALLSTPQFQKCIEVPFDHITIVFCNNHINLFDPDKCGVLHDAYMSSPGNQAPATRRVALCSIQDRSHAEAYRQVKLAHQDEKGWNPYNKLPYITPQFRSVAVAYLQKETRARHPAWMADGFWDGGKHEWLTLPSPGAEQAAAAGPDAEQAAAP